MDNQQQQQQEGPSPSPGQPQTNNGDGYNMQNLNDSARSAYDGFTNSVTGIRDSVNESVKDFSSKDIISSGTEFLNSNTLVAKFVFLLLILIVFMVLLNLGAFLVMYFMRPDRTPHVVRGLIDGNRSITIPQDPKNSGSITIFRSNNENKGIEFTWSVWLYRRSNDRDERWGSSSYNTYDHIFSKGEYTPGAGGYEGVSEYGNAPGVYFFNDDQNKESNKIKVFMDTITNVGSVEGNNVEIDNVPFKRWFHLAVRMENKIMDIYVNGTIAKRVTFEEIPKQNYGDVHVCKNGGFSGNLSDLRYFDKALNVFELMNIVNAGPNLRSNDTDKSRTYDYLSNSWYMGTN